MRIEDAGGYLSALSESLYSRQPQRGDNEIDSGVWTRGDAEVSRSATLVGPLVIDHGAAIDEGALIVGPTYVGPGAAVFDNITPSVGWHYDLPCEAPFPNCCARDSPQGSWLPHRTRA